MIQQIDLGPEERRPPEPGRRRALRELAGPLVARHVHSGARRARRVDEDLRHLAAGGLPVGGGPELHHAPHPLRRARVRPQIAEELRPRRALDEPRPHGVDGVQHLVAAERQDEEPRRPERHRVRARRHELRRGEREDCRPRRDHLDVMNEREPRAARHPDVDEDDLRRLRLGERDPLGHVAREHQSIPRQDAPDQLRRRRVRHDGEHRHLPRALAVPLRVRDGEGRVRRVRRADERRSQRDARAQGVTSSPLNTRRAGPRIVAAHVPASTAMNRSPPGSRTRTGAP